jgi:hypothetical protein
MRWLLRLGLGASRDAIGLGSIYWDEYVETPPTQWHAAVEFAQRAADAIIEHAVARAGKTEPVLVMDGPRIRVAFTARVLSTYTGPGQDRIERLVGPEEFEVSNVGVAIGVGRDACRAGAKVLQEFNRGTLIAHGGRGKIDG